MIHVRIKTQSGCRRSEQCCSAIERNGPPRLVVVVHTRIDLAFASSRRSDHTTTASDCAATTGGASVWAGGSTIEVVSRDLR